MYHPIFQDLARQFHQSGQTQPLIIYDVDDFLWSLTARAAKICQIDWHRLTAAYYVQENNMLTADERERILVAYGQPETFEHIEFFPGIEQILRPQELGAIVKINSNSGFEPIADRKREQLLKAIPGLKPEQLQMNIIINERGKKPLDPHTTIFGDDSPRNIALSPAMLNIMPTSPTWSSDSAAKTLVNHRSVIWLPNLTTINQFVYEAVDYLMNSSDNLD